MADQPRIDLFERFPDMQPVTKAPGLETMNGIGTMLLGRRDYDEETGTYVKTRYFTFLFLPLFALNAFRVFDAPEGGWYFLGKVPLSSFARNGNRLLGLLTVLIACLGGYFAYTGTDAYKAGQIMAKAEKLVGEGKGKDAAGLYRDVMLGVTDHAMSAREKFDAMVKEPPGDLHDAAGIYQVALDLHRQEKHTIKDLFGQAMALVRGNEEKDPAGSLALLEIVSPLASKPEEHLNPRRRMLERLVDKSPEDVDLCSRLAVVCADQGDLKRCVAVLTRHEDKLGDREGAAILGQIYASQGKVEKAQKLLSTYVDARLPRLRRAEQEFLGVREAAERAIVASMQTNKAPGFNYSKYRASTQNEQDRMVFEYMNTRIREDANIRSSLMHLAKEQAVVPAAIELGIVRLQHAQSMQDPEARQKELKKAEETFLAVGSFARESDKYRLSLGQVYYWLGKPQEGKKLFDEFLEKHQRKSQYMVAVGGLLREVGAISEARALHEEAFDKETDPKLKQQIAGSRSVMFVDIDDKILWLGRSNATEPSVQALLCEAKGTKATQDNKDAEAEQHLKQALVIYAKMPENAATLNNSALVHFSLYRLNQDPEQFQRGMDKLDRAVALKPGDSILLDNAARLLLQATARDLIGKSMDWKVLKRTPGVDMLSYLYRDKAERDEYATRLRTHAGFAKSRGYYEKLLVLAPRRPDAYQVLEWMYDYLYDTDNLKRLVQRVEGAQLDLAEDEKRMKEFLAGAKDEKQRDETLKSIARAEEVLPTARKVGGVTLAVAASRLASARMGAVIYDLPVDVDSIVKLANEAYTAAPSSATRSMLVSGYLFRAHQTMAKQDKTYAELASKTKRSMGMLLMTWVLSSPGPMCDLALANADVKQALKLEVEQVNAFSEDMGVTAWAMLRMSHPEVAAKVAASMKANPRESLKRVLNRATTAMNAGAILERYWTLTMEGKKDEANQWLAEQAKRGIALPTSLTK